MNSERSAEGLQNEQRIFVRKNANRLRPFLNQDISMLLVKTPGKMSLHVQRAISQYHERNDKNLGLP
jgi:hypothetical protein